MREQPRKAKRSQLHAEPMLLVALLLLAIAAGLTLAPRRQVALADLLFQSPATNTPDPNSPLPTSTPTWTPFPTDTPTPLVTPSDTPTAPPTNTPFVFPTDTPFVLPTDTPLAPPIDAPTPSMPALEPILPPPAPPPTSSQSITTPLEIILVEPAAAEEQAPAEDQAVERRLDLALFIDNLVIAFGYVWMCFGGLAVMAAVLGGVWLWRRRVRPPEQPVPDPGQPPAQPPPPPSTPPATPPRVAARRRSAPPQDLD